MRLVESPAGVLSFAQPATLLPVFRVREPVTFAALPVPAWLPKVYTRCVVLSNARPRDRTMGAFAAYMGVSLA